MSKPDQSATNNHQEEQTAKSVKKWVMVIDVALCHDCNNCFVACKDEHLDNEFPGYTVSQPRHGHRWINIMPKERGQFPLIDVAYRPTPCMHCQDAPCQKAAKNDAVYTREDGIVIIDPVKAKGQEHLIKACPYGAIWWNEEKQLPQKCTLCAHLLDQGWKQTRCVQACPTGALALRSLDESELESISENENLEILYPKYQSNPLIRYKNLGRYEKCFIAGSVAADIQGQEECIDGASVTLFDSVGAKIQETLTDSFGDFKLDGLLENTGPYRLEVSISGFETKKMEIASIAESLNIGLITL